MIGLPAVQQVWVGVSGIPGHLDEAEDGSKVMLPKTMVASVFCCKHSSNLVGRSHVEEFGNDELFK